tara:strand:- start:513 stop:1751 length:1239 start_codon:yes stop_codon:yes gene_type:complete
LSLKSKIKDIILSNAAVSNNRTIGVEEESLVFQGDGKRIPVKSKTTLDAKTLIQNLNQKTKNNGFYTLEPGGQVEWSSPPLPDLNQLYQAMKKHQLMLESELSASQLKIIYFGLDPMHDPKEIKLLDDRRYQIMDKKMRKIGGTGRWMMRNTASIQVSIDFTDLRDLEEMVFVADCLHPVAAYLFANSPYKMSEGIKKVNIRNVVWHHTDKVRCRNLSYHDITSSNGLLDKYIDFVLNVPAIFEISKGNAMLSSKKKIGDLISGDAWKEPLFQDHILYFFRQIFTNVRIKNVVEIRGSDRPPRGFEIAPVAFWSGLLTEKKTRKKIFNICSRWTADDRDKFYSCSMGLDENKIGPEGKTYLSWVKQIGELSLQGLINRTLGEEKYFESFYDIIIKNGPYSIQEQKKSPTYSP